MNVLHIYFCNLKRAKIYELLNAHLVRNAVSITVQKFLQDFFLNCLAVPDSHHGARFQAGQGADPPVIIANHDVWLPVVTKPWTHISHATLKFSASLTMMRDTVQIFSSFTKSIAKKLSSNEMSSFRASLAL